MVATVSITGKILDPAGLGVVGGTVLAELSEPGRLPEAIIGGSVLWTLGPGGSLPANATLIPNDVIAPAGTTYRVRVEALLADGTRSTWTETWQLASTPNPIAVGAILR